MHGAIGRLRCPSTQITSFPLESDPTRRTGGRCMGAERYLTESTLYPGPWYRRSPYFEATVRAGCKAYDVYNHTLLPGYYDDPNVEYEHLLNARGRLGCRRRVDDRGERPRRRPPDRHDHVPRPHEVRGEAGQVHARDRARRRHRERPGPAARRRGPVVDAVRRLRRGAVRARRRHGSRPRRERVPPRRLPDAGAGAGLGEDAREARRARDLRPEVLLVRGGSRSRACRS